MAEIYSLYNPRTSNHRDFTDAKEAGAAFFNEERADRPSVALLQEDPKAPGGRFFRPMAGTSIYGTYANGEKKFVKTLPNSHKGDDKFREGYMEALEKSVNERLKQTDWEKARPDHPMKAPNLDNKLYDDLDTLARVDDNKAIKAWKDNAPEWATPPAYADPAWNKEIAQAKRAAEFDAAQAERKQAEFESLLMEALEESVNERLKQADWEKARPDHPMKAPNLDNKLYDDLDTLARVDDNKAIKAWKDNAPEWATPPAYADPAWNKEIAQAKRAAEFDTAQEERKQAEFERMLPDDPTEKNVVSHVPEKLEGKLIEEKFRNDEVIRRENISARYKVEKYVPYSAEDTYSWSYEALPCISANTTDDQIMQLIDEIEFAANSRIGATLHLPTLAEMFTKRREVLKNLEEDESLGLG